ncbi:unnamed protein product [Phaedon cochleariae]|uniref:Rab3 GTPase-activating protein catalytic subunit n=1 Tax=Phaedon cochleariae TaxID=80249 RepID=A0A9N9SMU7_PHACE|nr:unnamed protein product [Phaedon cochleariae]
MFPEEDSFILYRLAPGVPDLRTCLLNQKLQMLNCCIERKLSRENSHRSTYDSAENSDTDDEFFDCSDRVDEETKRKEKHSLWNQPVGRLTKFGDLKLLKNGDPLYIPVTQEPVPKTEDQLEEDTDVLLKLGSDAEASELRARIMSASLLSDMESFKAANPGSVVEDFIRWYSPRDWIEEDDMDEWGQKKGHLSPRMLIEENNIWVQMWESSRPVPACRQKRLFDDTREAEKVLQNLDSRTISQICDLVIPVLSHAAICRLVEECRHVSAELSESNYRIKSLLGHGERLSRDPDLQPRRFEAFVQEVTALELLISQINSLQYKFNPSGAKDQTVSGVVANLVAAKEVEIEGRDGSDVGGRIVSMFSEMQNFSGEQESMEDAKRSGNGVFPAPSGREFVMRVNAVKPAGHSAKCPQFLRAILNKNEFRLAGAFSEDIVFF